MLEDILKNKLCFKLVCGAGNEDAEEVEKLVYLYSKAGANFFDISAKPEIIDAAKNGLKRAGIKDNRYLCVSVGIQGDPHVTKYEIDSEKCKKCGRCFSACPQRAIKEGSTFYKISRKNCIGCGKCLIACKHECIKKCSEFVDLKQILPPLIKEGIDCVELHISGVNESEIFEKWNDINHLYSGMLSICVDRSKFGNEQMLNIINKMLEARKPYTTIIQADGAPMSGSRDDYKTTLQTVACAEIVQDAKFPAYILLSGGTNSKTSELAKMCGIDYNGISVGTYARQIVKSYIDRKDFYENKEIFDKAYSVANELINSVLSS